MENSGQSVLLTGASGFVGGRLTYALDREGYRVKCLVRSESRLRVHGALEHAAEVVTGDLLEPETLVLAMEGVQVSYYLVHSMGGFDIGKAKEFADRDAAAARNFREAAEAARVRRIIYLGGLGDSRESGPDESESALSEHLASRLQVGRILGEGEIPVTILRAAVIIGAGGASFEMIRHIVERMPVIFCPREIDTRCQPISVANVIDYLMGCLADERTAGLTMDIGGPDVITYRGLMELYARVRGLKRAIIRTPGLSPDTYGRLVEMIAPVPAGIVSLLLAGMSNEVLCRDSIIRDLIPIKLQAMSEAICEALVEEEKGPGSLPSRQACFLD